MRVSIADELFERSVVEIAERMEPLDLLREYRRLTAQLMAEPPFCELADLATLCAVAIARVQLLEREREESS